MLRSSVFRLSSYCFLSSFFFFNHTAPTTIYTLSLHDALPIYSSWDGPGAGRPFLAAANVGVFPLARNPAIVDRKSTRLNSSHQIISYAVFCLKKKNTSSYNTRPHPSVPKSRAPPLPHLRWRHT